MNTIRKEFRYSTASAKSTFWVMAGLGVFSLVLALLPFLSQEKSLIFTALFGALAVFFFGFGHWYRRRLENDRSPKLIVDSGFIHAPSVTTDPIPWEDVEKIIFVQSKPKKPGYMSIDVRGDVNRFHPAGAAKILAKTNQALAGGELVVTTDTLDGTHADIRAAIVAAKPDVEIRG